MILDLTNYSIKSWYNKSQMNLLVSSLGNKFNYENCAKSKNKIFSYTQVHKYTIEVKTNKQSNYFK